MLHFCIFGYNTYIFFSSKVYANKLVLYSELMIFIGYKNNDYYFICYIQGNIIFHSIYAIFNKKLLFKYIEKLTVKNMVHAWTMEIKSRVEDMTSGHMYTACWP